MPGVRAHHRLSLANLHGSVRAAAVATRFVAAVAVHAASAAGMAGHALQAGDGAQRGTATAAVIVHVGHQRRVGWRAVLRRTRRGRSKVHNHRRIIPLEGQRHGV